MAGISRLAIKLLLTQLDSEPCSPTEPPGLANVLNVRQDSPEIQQLTAGVHPLRIDAGRRQVLRQRLTSNAFSLPEKVDTVNMPSPPGGVRRPLDPHDLDAVRNSQLNIGQAA